MNKPTLHDQFQRLLSNLNVAYHILPVVVILTSKLLTIGLYENPGWKNPIFNNNGF